MDKLPVELISKISYYLTDKKKLSFRTVCRYFAAINITLDDYYKYKYHPIITIGKVIVNNVNKLIIIVYFDKILK
jgi:hypothetical protein